MTNPVYWLAGRYSSRMSWVWLLPAAAGLAATSVMPFPRSFAPPVVIVCCAVNLVILLQLAKQAPRCLNEARRLGALEALLTSPMTNDDILRGHRLALRKAFTPVLCAVFAIEFIATADLSWGSAPACFAFCLGCVYALLPFAVINAGMWFGLTSKSEDIAAAKTIFFVLVLPTLLAPLSSFGLPLLIVIPLFWSAYANRKLRAELRTRAAMPIG